MSSTNEIVQSDETINAYFVRIQKEITALGFPISIDELRTAITLATSSEIFRKMMSWLSGQIIKVRELKNIREVEFSHSVPLFIIQLRRFLTDIGCPFITSNENEGIQSEYVRNVDTLVEYMTTELATARLLKDTKRPLNTKKKKKERAKKTNRTRVTQVTQVPQVLQVPQKLMSGSLAEFEWNILTQVYDSLLLEYHSEREKTLENLNTTITSLMNSCGLNSRKKEFFDEINKRISMIPALSNVLPEDVMHVRNVVIAGDHITRQPNLEVGFPALFGKNDSGIVSYIERIHRDKEPDLVKIERRSLSSVLNTDTTTRSCKERPIRDNQAKKCQTEMKSKSDLTELKNKISAVLRRSRSICEHRQSVQRRDEAIKNEEKSNEKNPEVAREHRSDKREVSNDGLDPPRNSSLNRQSGEITREGKQGIVHERKVVPDKIVQHQDHIKNIHMDNVISMQHKSPERKPYENHPGYQPIANKSHENNLVYQPILCTPHDNQPVNQPTANKLSENHPVYQPILRTPYDKQPIYKPPNVPLVQRLPHKGIVVRQLPPSPPIESISIYKLKRNYDSTEGKLSVKQINESRFCESDSARKLVEPYQSEVRNSMSLLAKRDPRLLQHDPRLVQHDPSLVQHDPNKAENSTHELINRDPRLVHRYPRKVGNSMCELVNRDPRLTGQDPGSIGSSISELAQYNNHCEVGNSTSKLVKCDPRLVQHDSSEMGNSVLALITRDPRLVQHGPSEVGSLVRKEYVRYSSRARNSMRQQVAVDCINQDGPSEQWKKAKRSLGSNDGDRQMNMNYYDNRRVEDPSQMWNESKNCDRNDDVSGLVNRDSDFSYRKGSNRMSEEKKCFDGIGDPRELEYRYVEGRMDLCNQAECIVDNSDANSVIERDLHRRQRNDKNMVTAKSHYGQGNEYVSMHERSEHAQEVDTSSGLQHHLKKSINDNTTSKKRTEPHDGKTYPEAKHQATKHTKEKDKSVHRHAEKCQTLPLKNKDNVPGKSDIKIPQKRSKSRSGSVTERSKRAGSRRERNSHGRDRGH